MRGAGWVNAQRLLERGLSLASLLVLGRLLAPADFGLVAIATGVAWVLEGVTEFEVRGAVIQAREQDRSLHDTAWTLAGLRGLVIALLMLLGSCFCADLRLGETLMVLALCPLLDGLVNPRFALFERDLEFYPSVLLSSSAALISGGVTILSALLLRSHWALVFGLLAGSATRVLLSYTLRPYRPRWALARWRTIWRFGGWMSLATLITALTQRSDRLIVGALLGFDRAGSYYMVQRLALLPTLDLIAPLGRVLFPAFARLAHTPERLRQAVRESLGALATLTLPLACGLAVVADDGLVLVLGERWRPIVPLLVVLLPFLSLRAILLSARTLAMALGQTRFVFVSSAVLGAIQLPLFSLLTWSQGLPGSIGAVVVVGLVAGGLHLWMFRRLVDLRLMVVALWAMDAGREALLGPFGPWSLVLEVLTGGLLFGVSQWSLWVLAGRPAGIEQRLESALAKRVRAQKR
jgi:PST family polysaccharide transporter